MNKTFCDTLTLFLLMILLLLVTRQIYAIQGQLNYGFELPQRTVVVKDAQEIDACNKKNVEINTTAQNCLKTNALLNNTLKETVKRFEKQTQTYLLLLIITGAVALVFFIMAIILFIKWQKKTTPPLLSTDHTPPPTMDDSGQHASVL